MTDESEESTSGAVVRVKYKSQTPEAFALEHGGELSADGIFIKTKSPLALGRPLRLQLMLADGERVILGTGRVRFRREQAGVHPPGMGIEFVELDIASRRTVDNIVAGRQGADSLYDLRDNADVIAPSSVPPAPKANVPPGGLFTSAAKATTPSSTPPPLRLGSFFPPAPQEASSKISGLFSSAPAPSADSPISIAPTIDNADDEMAEPGLEERTSGSFFSLPDAPRESRVSSALPVPPPARMSTPSMEPAVPSAVGDADHADATAPSDEESLSQGSSIPPPLPSQRAAQARRDSAAEPNTSEPTTGEPEELSGLFDDITLINSDRPGSERPAASALDADVFSEGSAEEASASSRKSREHGRPSLRSLVGLEGPRTLPGDAPPSRLSGLAFTVLLITLAVVGFSAAFYIASGAEIPTPANLLKSIQGMLGGGA